MSARRPPLALVVAALAFGAARPGALAAADKVPGVVLSPKAAESAPLVEARIAEVTVFSDRARVRRRGRAPGKAGVELVRFPSLPGAVFLDTIRVSATGGRVLRVEATPVERERLSIEQAGKLLDELDAVDDRLAEMDDRRAGDDWEVGFLRALSPALPVPEDKREGRKNLVVDVGVVVEGARLRRRARERCRGRPPAQAGGRAARPDQGARSPAAPTSRR